MMPVRYLAAGAALTALGLGLFLTTADASPAPEDKVPPLMTNEIIGADDAKALIEADTKVITDSLAKGDKKSQTKARVAAMLVALYGQTTKQAGPRDLALKVADEINKENAAEAKKAAEALAGGAAAAGGPKGPVPLHTMIDIADLMTVFKLEKAGGQELEKQLAGFTKNPDMAKAPVFAARLAFVSLYTESLPPQPAGGKDPKDWIKLSQEMRASALAAHKAAKAGDKAGVRAAMKKVDVACNDCHTKFRD